MKHFIIRVGLAAVALVAGFIAIPAVQALQTAVASPAAPAPRAPASPASSGTYVLDWAAVGEIGGGASASSRYLLNATVGQAAATEGQGVAYRACSGFECVRSFFALMLPHTRRDTSAGW